MSVLKDVFEAVVGLAQATNPYATIFVGALPADNGLSMFLSSGAPEHTFLTKGAAYRLSVLLNGKHTDQQTVLGALDSIHHALTTTKTYPATGDFQITNIETTAAPSYIGREQGEQHIYGSSLAVKFFYFNKEG